MKRLREAIFFIFILLLAFMLNYKVSEYKLQKIFGIKEPTTKQILLYMGLEK